MRGSTCARIERGRFPGLMATLERAGYDPAVEPIPVSPAAHYTVGGIVTDLDGRTSVPGLYAAGECAATGVHGANRLASNSLLECLVFGRRAALAALAPSLCRWPGCPPSRSPSRRRAPSSAGALGGRGRDPQRRGPRAASQAPRALLPRLIAESALTRRESRGAHFRSDFPTEDDAFRRHVVLRRGHEPVLEPWS